MNNKIILGTVQFGLNYGINNSGGQISQNDVREILNYANFKGINLLDTASSYGISEQVIGEYLNENKDKDFKVISKLFLKNQTLENSLFTSLERLNINKLETILFHSFDDYLLHKQELNYFIAKYKGILFEKIGVSAYTNKEVDEIIKNDHIDILQMPFNILDNASIRENTYLKVKKAGKILHTRSVFLQGLIFKKIHELQDEFLGLKNAMVKIENLCTEYKIAINELALSYVLSKDYIDGVLIGVDSLEHLKKNVEIREFEIPQNLITEIDNLIVDNQNLLNPTNWIKK